MRDLLEQRAAKVKAMREIADHPAGDGGDLSDEQVTAFNSAKAELERLEARIEVQRTTDEAERRMAAPAIVSGRGDGAYDERCRDFSIARAICARLGDPVDDGLERELSTELRQRTPGRAWGGIPVPDGAFMVEQRTLLTSGDAAALFPTTHRGDLFVDVLRSQMVTSRLGATIVDGLVGDQSIPRQIASSTAEHIAEDAPLTESDADTDEITLSPKTVGALTSFSRRALINSVPSVEQLVRRDLAAVIARAIDFQALLGDGTGNTPVGIVNQTGVAVASLAGPTWAEVLAFVASIQSADAEIGALGWTMNPNAVATLRATIKHATAAAGFLMDTPDMLAGYRVAPTTAIPDLGGPPVTDRQVIFGAWSQLLIGRWSGIDLLANPFGDAAFARGRVQVRAMADYDVAVRHGEAFAAASDLPV